MQADIQSQINATEAPVSSKAAETSSKSVNIIDGFMPSARILAREDSGLADSTNIWHRNIDICGLPDELKQDINIHRLRIGNASDIMSIELPDRLREISLLGLNFAPALIAFTHIINRLPIGFLNGRAVSPFKYSTVNRRSQDTHDPLSHEHERAETLYMPETRYTHYIRGNGDASYRE